MAEITDKTIKELNRLLADLARDARESSQKPTDDSPGSGGPSRRRRVFDEVDITDIEAQEKRLKELNEELEKTGDLYSNLSEGITKKYTVAMQKARIATEETRLENLENMKVLTEQKKKLEDAAAAAQAEIEAKEKGGESTASATQELVWYQDQLDEVNGKLKSLTAAQKGLNTQLSNTEKALGAEQGLANHFSELGKKITGTALKTGGFGDNLNQLGKQFRKTKALGGSGFKALAVGAADFAKNLPLKFFDSIVNGTIELAKAQDKAISAFRRATGAGKEYNLEITSLERSTRFAGVTAEEAGKAYQTLFTSFSEFTQLSETEREVVSETTALLSELGVSGQTTAKIFDQMSRSLGMSVGASNDVMLRLAGTAKSLGVSMGKMASDFQGAFSELSKYGNDAIDVFEGLAKQSKATGIEVGKLMGIAKQFDTFDGAAKSVGRLNAILGGPYLNSIDMLNASEAERIDLLKSSVDASGVQFEAMNRFEKQAIAAALGMSVEDASRIMQMSTAEMELQALQQEELAELAQNSQEIMDQLKNAFQSMLVDMRPLIEDVIVPTVEFLGKIGQWFGTAESAMTRFMKVGLLAAGVAALIAAPFTGGTSLAMWASVAAIGGTAGLIAGATYEGGGEGGASEPGAHRQDLALARGGLVNLGPKKSAALQAGARRPDMMLAPGGEVNLEPARGGGSFLDKLYAAVGLNEHGPETAVLPYGTYVTNAADTKESISMATAVVAELKGLREDISRGGTQRVKLVLDNGEEFASTVINTSGLSPFG